MSTIKTLTDLHAFLLEAQQSASLMQREASKTGNPGMERSYHGRNAAYINALTAVEELIRNTATENLP
jgi:hypothetical protein